MSDQTTDLQARIESLHRWQQRRDDLAWLLWDLRERRREARHCQTWQLGVMYDAAVESELRCSRLIELVKEVNA